MKHISLAMAFVMVLAASGCRRETAYELQPNGRASAVPLRTLTPVSITVIADGFGPNDSLTNFEAVLADVHERDPFDVKAPGSMTSVLAFRATKKLNTKVFESALGLIPTEDRAECYFRFEPSSTNGVSDQQAFLDKLQAESGTPPGTEMTIVVLRVKDGMKTGACATGRNLILTSQNVTSFTIAHELGHALAGLKDEISSGAQLMQANHSRPNCSGNSASPGWKMFKQAGSQEILPAKSGCEGFSDLFRPSDMCRMITSGNGFCCVCNEHLLRQLSDRVQAQMPRPDPMLCEVDLPAPPVQPSETAAGTYVTADFYATRGEIISVRGGLGDARDRLVAGDFFASITANGLVSAAASLPDDPAFARAYPPEEFAIDERVLAPLPTRVTIFMPGSSNNLRAYPVSLPGNAGTRLLNNSFRNELTSQLPP